MEPTKFTKIWDKSVLYPNTRTPSSREGEALRALGDGDVQHLLEQAVRGVQRQHQLVEAGVRPG